LRICCSRLVRAGPDSLTITITITLTDADGGTDLLAVHDRLPPGVSTTDNEAGWRTSLAKLAALVEAGYK
jgi:hypothetical protein